MSLFLRTDLLNRSDTSVWTPGRRCGWGNPVCRYGFPPAHRYTGADPEPGEGPAYPPEMDRDTTCKGLRCIQDDLSLKWECPMLTWNRCRYLYCYISWYLFLVVGNDAADEVGVGVSERGHEFGQLLFIELPDGPEHSLTGLKRTGQLRHAGHLIQTHDTVHWETDRHRERESRVMTL